MKKQTLLWFADVHADGMSAWSFVIREDDGPVKGRYLHAGSAAVKGAVLGDCRAACHGLGHGLRWLIDTGRTTAPLLVRGGNKTLGELITRAWVGEPPDGPAVLSRVLELFDAFPAKEFSWINRDENANADELARTAWESAAGVPFPGRPSRRKRLPGLCR